MGKQSARKQARNDAEAKSESQKPAHGWRPIFSGALAELESHSWLQNFLIGLALLLVWPFIGVAIMKTYKATIIGFGIGATILIWIGVAILLRQTSKTDSAPSSGDKARSTTPVRPAFQQKAEYYR